MNIKNALIVLILPLFIMACRPGIDEAKLAKIDSLQQVLDSSQQKINVVDSTKIRDYAHHYFENLNYIKNKFNDTVETETAFFIDKYYGMRKAIKMIQQQYSTVSSELKISQKQLKLLKHDAEKGLLEDNQFDQYLELESKNVQQVRSAIIQISNAYNHNIPLYEEMNASIDSIIAEDKKKAKGAQS